MDELKRIGNRMNATIYMAVAFTIIPLAYYLRAIRVIDADTYLLTILVLNLVSKTLFIQALSSIHSEYYDPIKVSIICIAITTTTLYIIITFSNTIIFLSILASVYYYHHHHHHYSYS